MYQVNVVVARRLITRCISGYSTGYESQKVKSCRNIGKIKEIPKTIGKPEFVSIEFTYL